jgi:malonyl CoA-acyl carrier protein transacylase
MIEANLRGPAKKPSMVKLWVESLLSYEWDAATAAIRSHAIHHTHKTHPNFAELIEYLDAFIASQKPKPRFSPLEAAVERSPTDEDCEISLVYLDLINAILDRKMTYDEAMSEANAAIASVEILQLGPGSTLKSMPDDEEVL